MKKENKENKTLSNIYGAIVLIFIISALIGIPLVAKKNPLMALFMFGIYFLFFGMIIIVPMIKEKSLKKNIPILIFPIIGFGICVVSGIYMWGSKYNIVLSEKTVPALILILFVIMGVGFTFIPMISNKNKKEKWSLINAKCTKLNSRFLNDNDSGYSTQTEVYAPTFEYSYNGNQYSTMSNTYSNVKLPKIDEYYDIYVNPDNPNEIYQPSIANSIVLFIIGSSLLFSGIGCLYLLLK